MNVHHNLFILLFHVLLSKAAPGNQITTSDWQVSPGTQESPAFSETDQLTWKHPWRVCFYCLLFPRFFSWMFEYYLETLDSKCRKYFCLLCMKVCGCYCTGITVIQFKGLIRLVRNQGTSLCRAGLCLVCTPPRVCNSTAVRVWVSAFPSSGFSLLFLQPWVDTQTPAPTPGPVSPE